MRSVSELHEPAAGRAAATPADVAQAGERRSARIESLRALAALGVLVGHSWGWAHGYRGDEVFASYGGRVMFSGGFGVFLFFSLSGYLLFLPFVRAEFATGTRIDLARYALNRVLRVVPLYYVVIVTYLLVIGDGVRGEWRRFLLFVNGFFPDTVARVDGPAWSLMVEVQFYALLPLFAWLVVALSRRSLGRAAAVVAVLGLAAMALRVATVTTPDSVTAVWRYSLPSTCVYFFPGLLLAIAKVAADRRPPAWMSRPVVGSARLWFAAGVGLWLFVAYRFWDMVMLPGAALMLGACALPLRQSPTIRLLDHRGLAGLGVASYSLYLWHGPIVHALSDASWVPGGFGPLVVVSAVLCSAVAVASYRLIEAPFLRLRRSWSRSATANSRSVPLVVPDSTAVPSES